MEIHSNNSLPIKIVTIYCIFCKYIISADVDIVVMCGFDIGKLHRAIEIANILLQILYHKRKR